MNEHSIEHEKWKEFACDQTKIFIFFSDVWLQWIKAYEIRITVLFKPVIKEQQWWGKTGQASKKVKVFFFKAFLEVTGVNNRLYTESIVWGPVWPEVA